MKQVFRDHKSFEVRERIVLHADVEVFVPGSHIYCPHHEDGPLSPQDPPGTPSLIHLIIYSSEVAPPGSAWGTLPATEEIRDEWITREAQWPTIATLVREAVSLIDGVDLEKVAAALAVQQS